MSHHSSDDNEHTREAMSEVMRKVFGEYPEGKLNAADEGAIAMAVGHQNGKVVIQFPKPVSWIGFTAAGAVELAQSLLDHARAVDTGIVIQVRIGAKP